MNQPSKKRILLIHPQPEPDYNNKLYANVGTVDEMLEVLAPMCTFIHYKRAVEFMKSTYPGDWMRIWLTTANTEGALFCLIG